MRRGIICIVTLAGLLLGCGRPVVITAIADPWHGKEPSFYRLYERLYEPHWL